MKPEERLFSAIGGVDEPLLERSERLGARPRVWMRAAHRSMVSTRLWR